MSPLTIKILSGILITGLGSAGIVLTHKYLGPKTIEEKLKEDGYRLLDASSTSDKDDSEWKKIIKTWTDDSNNELSSFVESSQTEENGKIKALKNKCRSIMGMSSKNEKFISTLSKSQKYCVASKPTQQT